MHQYEHGSLTGALEGDLHTCDLDRVHLALPDILPRWRSSPRRAPRMDALIELALDVERRHDDMAMPNG